MEAITDPNIERVVVQKARRVGYTKILDHAWGYLVHIDPCGVLIVNPTVEDAHGFSKEEVAPTIAETPVLAELMSDPKSRDSSNTILKKTATNGAVLTMVGANSPRSFRRLTCRAVLFDEIDGYPTSAGTEGDQIALGIGRTDWAHNRIILMGSTPTIRGFSKIEAAYLETDQRKYFVPCAHCGHMQILVWANMKWPKRRPLDAEYECESCARMMKHKHKFEMVENGEWRGTIKDAPQPKWAGFHIWAAYSYAPNASWGQLASEFLEAKKRPETLQVFVNQIFGETWEEAGASVDPHRLLARREIYNVPITILALTAGVDVQADRLELILLGWGLEHECWALEYEVFRGDPHRPEVWAELLAYLSKSWERDDGKTLQLRCTLIDSGGHHTQDVYRFCRGRWPTILPAKGEGQSNALDTPLTKAGSRIPVQPSGSVQLVRVNADEGKALVYGRLNIDEPGPGFVHFHTGFGEPFMQGLTSEVYRTKEVAGRPKGYWQVKPGLRNEPLDVFVYAVAALDFVGIGQRELVQRRDVIDYKPNLVEPHHRAQAPRARKTYSTYLRK